MWSCFHTVTTLHYAAIDHLLVSLFDATSHLEALQRLGLLHFRIKYLMNADSPGILLDRQ